MSERKLHTLAEVHEMTGFPLRALKDGCRSNRITHVYKFRKRYLTPAQIDKLIRESTVDATRPFMDEVAADELDRRRAARRRRPAA
jgi:hypothetical protein